MGTLRIRLHNAVTGERKTVQLPDSMPVERLIPALIKQLKLPQGDYQLRLEGEAAPLGSEATMSGLGVADGTSFVIEKAPRAVPTAPPAPPVARKGIDWGLLRWRALGGLIGGVVGGLHQYFQVLYWRGYGASLIAQLTASAGIGLGVGLTFGLGERRRGFVRWITCLLGALSGITALPGLLLPGFDASDMFPVATVGLAMALGARLRGQRPIWRRWGLALAGVLGGLIGGGIVHGPIFAGMYWSTVALFAALGITEAEDILARRRRDKAAKETSNAR